MTKKGLAVSFILLLAGGPFALGAVVRLKDGTQVRGTVVSATAQDVTVQTDAGVRTIPSSGILSIDYGEGGAPAQQAAPQAPPPLGAYEYRRPRRYWRQEPPVRLEDLKDSFTVDFGVASPTSRVSADDTGGSAVSNGGSGVLFGLRFLHVLSPRLEAGVGVDFSDRGDVERDGLLPLAQSNIYGDTFMPMALLKVGLTPGRSFAHPYFLAGAGPDHTSLTVDARPDFGYVWGDTGTDETRRLVDGANWGWAAKAAFGMDFGLGSPSDGGFELGWVGVQNPSYEGTADGRALGLNSATGKLSELTFSLHWGWRY